MIGRLKGQVLEAAGDQVLVDVGGVGFEVSVPLRLAAGWTAGQEVALYTVFIVREDGMSLYGFGTGDEKALFRSLLSVSGVGPKAALQLLSSFSGSEVRNAIVQEKTDILTKAPGIGSKTAKRLILELKEKLKADDLPSSSLSAPNSPDISEHEALESLLALGFARAEARQALLKVREEVDSLPVEEQLKRALRFLAKGPDFR